MAYSDFTLADATTRLALFVDTWTNFTTAAPSATPGPILTAELAENVSVAVAIHSEKARSELIVAPVLMEVRRQLGRNIGLFSGHEFPVDPAAGLTGTADFMLTRSRNQLVVTAPVAAVVEAKRDSIPDGLGQCAAIMVAIQRFNAKADLPAADVLGCVTTGSLWKFLRLRDSVLEIDADEFHIGQIDRILGVWVQLLAPAPGAAAAA